MSGSKKAATIKKVSPKKTTGPKTERKSGKKVSRLLGMKDMIGLEQKSFDLVYNKAMELARAYNFLSIKVPILESYDLFKKSTRRDIDKEFYFVEGDKANRIILRPEITQGIARAYVENNVAEIMKVARFYNVGPVFRQEKLQTGRYRESTQLNLEIIGEKKAMAEALVIALANNFFKELNIKAEVQINSLGDADCQKDYCNKLIAFYKERGRRTKLCNECKKSVTNKNCLALLDCKNEACVKAREEAPQMADFLSDDSREHFAKVLEYLDELEINYNFNPYLVRGLSYYNDTVFEFWPINEDGTVVKKLALGGGGRYDKLIESVGGQETPAVGLALGLERAVARLKNKSEITKSKDQDVIFIAQLGDQAKVKALQLFNELREAGFDARHSFSTDSLRTQLEEATEMNAKVSLILGKKEIMDETILMRDMESSAQETVVYKKIKNRLMKIEGKVINRKGGGLSG